MHLFNFIVSCNCLLYPTCQLMHIHLVFDIWGETNRVTSDLISYLCSLLVCWELCAIIVAVWNRADHYILALWFLLLLSSFFSSPNLSRHRLHIYHTSTHGVALVRIYAGLKCAGSKRLAENTGRKQVAQLSQWDRATHESLRFAKLRRGMFEPSFWG